MNDRFKKRAAISVIVSAVFFLILTTIAMFIFPGGYSIFHTVIYTTSYSFKINFFSDLGMLITETGESNIVSAILFFVALASMGVTFLLYSISLPFYFQKGTIQFRFAIIGSIFAVISAIGYIGVAFTPWDVLLGPHVLFVFIAFPVSLGYSCLFFIPIFMEGKYPNVFGYLLIGFSVAMGVYLWFLFGGSNALGLVGLQNRIVQALAQKVIVYLMIVLIPVEAIGSLIVLKRK